MKFRFIKLVSFIFICSLFITGCKKDDFKQEEVFVKIFDDTDGNKKFVPLSIQQTEDGGYMILSAVNGWNIFLMKTDLNGEVVWKKEVDGEHVNAAPTLIKKQGNYYFVCMDRVGLFTKIFQINQSSGSITLVNSFNSMLFPTAVYSDENTTYIQNYNRVSYKTEIHELNSTLTGVVKSGMIDVFTSVEDELVNHNSFNGRRFPFIIQKTSNGIVMTGFYNYSFSAVFLNSNLQFTGTYNGAGFNGGVNTILPLSGNQFAIGKFSNDNQYFNANCTLNPSTIDIAENISAAGYSELYSNKPIVTKSIKINGTNYICMLGSSRNNYVLMSIYNVDGTLVGQKKIGQNTPYTIYDAVQTSDEGMQLLIQVKLAGMYHRIGLVKISDEQLKEIIGEE